MVPLRKSQYANVSLEREIIRAATSSKCRIFLFNLPEKDASRLPEFERANDKIIFKFIHSIIHLQYYNKVQSHILHYNHRHCTMYNRSGSTTNIASKLIGGDTLVYNSLTFYGSSGCLSKCSNSSSTYCRRNYIFLKFLMLVFKVHYFL
jgi:hypothetical protein